MVTGIVTIGLHMPEVLDTYKEHHAYRVREYVTQNDEEDYVLINEKKEKKEINPKYKYYMPQHHIIIPVVPII